MHEKNVLAINLNLPETADARFILGGGCVGQVVAFNNNFRGGVPAFGLPPSKKILPAINQFKVMSLTSVFHRHVPSADGYVCVVDPKKSKAF